MLSNLDNEVIFKKAFTNKFVFEHFVKDITGVDVKVDKIETEKKFDDKVGFIDITPKGSLILSTEFKFDVFAESIDNRIIVEIQKVEYDYNFDRFINYFLSAIVEQQKSSKKYRIDKTVYTIILLTAPYTIKTKDNDRIQDEVLLSKLNPQNLLGQERKIFGHEIYFLNPNYKSEDTPQRYRDWLDLIYESIHNPENPKINNENAGIKKAAELIDKDTLTNEERTLLKQAEGRKVVLQIEREQGIEEGIEKGIEKGKFAEKVETVMNGNKEGLSNDLLSKLTGLSVLEIQEILKDILL